MANPYYIEPANPLQALMAGVQGYDKAQQAAKQAEAEAAYKQVGQQIQSGGIDKSALGQLFGVGPGAAPMLNAAAALNRAKMEGQGVYGTPIYATDEKGVTHLGAIGKQGQWHPIDTPGLTPSPGIKLADSGTNIYALNSRSGAVMGGPQPTQQPMNPGQPPTALPQPQQQQNPSQIVDQRFSAPPQGVLAPGTVPGVIPKDVQGRARQQEVGKTEGENITTYGKAESSVKAIASNLDRLASKATELMSHPGLNGITGLQAYVFNTKGSHAANAQALLESLKSQVSLDTLQAMREASKTGGALGNVSDAEGLRLERALTALDTSQDPVAFKMRLGEIIRFAKEAKGRSFGAFQQDYARLKNNPGVPATSTTAPPGQNQSDPLGIR